MIKLIDFHCHPDLYNDNFNLLKKAKYNNFSVIAMTNLPQLYKRYEDLFGGEESMIISLGYHPQLVVDYPNEMEKFLKYIKRAKFIGEVGLDKTIKDEIHINEQKEIFKRIIFECNKLGEKIISIHSRKADDIIFDFLKKSSCIYILHWYTGSKKRLLDAMAGNDNLYISINSDMISTIQGKKIVKDVPLSKIVLETDAPFTESTKNMYPESILHDIAIEIAKVRECDLIEILKNIEYNSNRILSI